MDRKLDAIFLTKILSKELEKKLDQNVASVDLTPQQSRIIFFIRHHEGEDIRQVDIRDKFKLTKSTMSGLISRLEAKGFIKKEKVKKTVVIRVTQKGIDATEKFAEENEALVEEMFKGFTPEERSEVIKGLNKMIQNIIEEEEITCGKRLNESPAH